MGKTNFFSLYPNTSVITLLCLLAFVSGFAQDDDETEEEQTGYHLGQIEMQDPNSIVAKYTYDPVLDRYIYTEKIGDVDVSYPLSLTPEEYQELILEEKMKGYFKEKSDAVAGRNQGEDDQKNLLPIFYVNNSFFESVFGGSEIEVIPQGSVEMDLGVLYTKQDNPSLSPRNRSNFTFDFDQRISLSMQGHVGERLQINANYDTQSTFDFQNQIKLEYTPDEDDIVKKIEIGNVNMPINSSLIEGAQSLFGVKTQLQFGKTTITGVFSEQNSERQTVNVEGGGAVEEFDKFIMDYDENRHFFLSHYFRDHYDEALENYPFINSNVQVTRIQIWVTNRSNNPRNLTSTRNIVALQDIGEANPENVGVLLGDEGNLVNPPSFAAFLNNPPTAFPDNQNNDFNPIGITGPQQTSLTPAIRDIASVSQGFGVHSTNVSEGVDYGMLENARQLDANEYTVNRQLGYISLNQRVSNDEVLGVAYQYTVNGQVYQVGEFANDGIESTGTAPNPNDPEGPEVAVTQNLVVKMLKSPVTNVNEPIWDLMMKNIYSLGVSQLEREDFTFNILYSDPQPLNYISPAENSTTPLPNDVEDTNLLQVFNLDKLNINNDPAPNGDGFFDYVPGLTIDEQNGNIIFTSAEPFGEYLFEKLASDSGAEDYDDSSTYNENQEKYVFNALYNTTKTQAEQEQADKNKFQLRGRYKSSGQDGIPIGAFNVPQGSVTVTAGGRQLQEGVDYTVDYQRGMVQIIDDALLASDTPIQVSTENNAMFGQQTKRFTGINIEHQFSEDFLIGATYLNLSERPLTQKANYSYEPNNNSIYGINLNYTTEVPFLTRLVNKLPNIDTDVESNFSVRGEFAYLRPGSPKADNFGGVATSYIDDFEASQTSVSVLSPLSWRLSSAPIGFGGEKANNNLSSGYQRAKLNWYTIDPVFYSNQRPEGITDNDLSQYTTRRAFIDEIFPNTDIVQGQTQAIFSLDLAYYPGERGQYNYNPVAGGTNNLPNPEDNFGGIMREITTTNFEQSNVEFIEFWIMDPFVYDENDNINDGKITFNLGSISEDILKDGRKQYENGLPKDGTIGSTLETEFGRVPSSQSLVYAFDSEGQERINQDVGLDGLNDEQEATKFPAFAGLADPSNDNYEYFLAAEGGVVERYRNYNGHEGNTPTEVGQNNRGNSTEPSVEDVNRDNTMNTIDSYFEYEVPVYRGMSVDNNTSSIAGIDQDYITDVKEVTSTMQNGEQIDTRWVQFKVPLRTDSEYSVGGIADLRSIRFMRMFLSDFEDDVVLRFGTLDLVRGDYRRYNQALLPDGTNPDNTPGTTLEMTAVSEEQTSDYVTPPGVVREELINNNQRVREDEQSLALTVKGLAPGDSRGVYKNFQIDMRQYKNLEMFLHAESLPAPSPTLIDGELTAFIRMGTDFTDNFYQVEIPLTVSDINSEDPRSVWPEANDLNLPFELLQQIKSTIIGDQDYNMGELNFFTENLEPSLGSNPGEMRIGIKGNPSFGNIRMLMVGVKNTGNTDAAGEVWFNELRMSDLKNEGGWAAVVNMDTNLADFATIAATGRRSTVGFGGIEQGPNQRSREDVKQYDVVTNINMGQMLPKNLGINLPFSYSRGEELITPQYDPEYLDLELETLLDNTPDPARREELRERAEDYTLRQSVSVIGLRKERTNQERTPMPYDIENFSFSATYNQIDHRDFEIEEALDQNVNVGATYDYGFKPLEIEPLKNVKFLDSSDYFAPLRDFNFNPLPTSISASSNIIRQYNEQVFREINLPPGSIGMPKLYQRNYMFDWQYTINHNLTKSLNFSFNTTNNRVVRNYINDQNEPDNTTGVWDNFFDVGIPNQHHQSLQINYDLPLNKIPALEFIRAQYSYTGNFQWQKGSEILRDLPGIPDLGNTIQNSNTHQINGTFEMGTLYSYIGLKKKGDQRGRSRMRRTSGNRLGFSRGGDDNKDEEEDNSNKLSAGDKAVNSAVGILTALKRVTLNYQETNGIYLPGYTNDIGFVGTLKPTPGFTFGLQDDVREVSARNGWLTSYQQFNEQYSETATKNLSIQANIGLLQDLTLDLNANRVYSDTYTENYRVNQQDMQYRSLTANAFGNFNISTIMISTAFSESNQNSSETFDQFRENRRVVANRLAARAGIDVNDSDNIDENGYPVGFGRTSQQVLLPAFLSAYTGSDANNEDLGAFRDVPLPNWNLKYTGLMRLDWFKDKFKRFSLQHGYTSIYNVNQFQSNLDYDRSNPYSEENKNQSGDFKSGMLISNVNLVEQFSPLIQVDMELKNSIRIMTEIRKDRALSLSFDNNLLTETQGNEYVFGLGYRVPDLRIATEIAGKRRILRSDLNFKADVSFRRNETIVRYLDLNNSQTTAGQDVWTINFTADYALSKNLTAIFYYDHSFSEYAISTAFPQTTIRSGITLRYNFGN